MTAIVRRNVLRSAYLAILLMGVVSLMGDIIYEGSRGIVPDYLKFMGASAFIVGLVGGLGEFIGYAARLVSGVLADTTRAYWLFIFLGYGLIISVPLLSVTKGWEIAIFFVLLERLGKALRSPSRDTVLSIVSKGVGSGKAFGVHELLDQVGAILGPFAVAMLMLYSNNNYSYTFSFMILPYGVLLLVLVLTYRSIGQQTYIEPKKVSEQKEGLSKSFHVYMAAVTLNTVGLIPISLILYKASEILQPTQQQWIVPILYMIVQGVDASIALISGYAYDRVGVRVLLTPFLLSILLPILALISGGLPALIGASIFYGLVLGMQESIYRAAVADLTPLASRGTAYGMFNAAYGLAFLISGAIYGGFIDLKIPIIVVATYAIITQLTAIALLTTVSKFKSISQP